MGYTTRNTASPASHDDLAAVNGDEAPHELHDRKHNIRKSQVSARKQKNHEAHLQETNTTYRTS
jgi:hypothetical protein